MSTPVHYQADILQCPACQHGDLQNQRDRLHCPACQKAYAITNGMPVLLTDPGMNTKLVDIDYDKLHYINENSRNGIHKSWKVIFEENSITGGDVLELGAGTGQLTWNLSHRFPFKHVHATDISREFLQVTADLIGPAENTCYYVCDANRLPFKAGSFDVIVGNSVLHHFLDYEHIIQQLHTLLRPGGHAIFFEPVLQGKVMVAFLANLILRTERNTGLAGLTEEDLHKLQHFIQHLTKSKRIGDDREKLASMEDKYIFDIHDMRELGERCGYQSSTYRNNPVFDGNFRINIGTHLERAGIEYPKISKYRFLINAFKENLADLIPRDMVTPMGYFIFKR